MADFGLRYLLVRGAFWYLDKPTETSFAMKVPALADRLQELSLEQRLYTLKELPAHLASIGDRQRFARLVTDFEFTQAKLNEFGPDPVIQDYDLLTEDNTGRHENSSLLQLLLQTLRLSAHILAGDASQLPGQLWGRLAGEQDVSGLDQLMLSIQDHAQRPWLQPIKTHLARPTGALIGTLQGQHSREIVSIAISEDCRLAASASHGVVVVWDLQTRSMKFTISCAPVGLAFAHHSEWLVIATWDLIVVWEMRTGTEIRRLGPHSLWIVRLAVTPNGGIALAADDQALKTWQLEKGNQLYREISTWGHMGIAIAPAGNRAVSAFNKKLDVWDLPSGSKISTYTGHSDRVLDVAITPDGLNAISASQDETLQLWSLTSGTEVLQFTGHTDYVTAVVVTSDGLTAVSGSADQTAKVWDIRTGSMICTLTGHTSGLTAVAVSLDGKYLLTGSYDGALKLWDLAAATSVRTSDAQQSSSDLRKRVFKDLQAHIEGQIQFMDPVGHVDTITAILPLSDGRRAISLAKGGDLVVWDIEAARENTHVRLGKPFLRSVALSPQDEFIVYEQDNGLAIQRLPVGEEIFRIKGNSGKMNSLSVSDDGKLAIAGSDDHLVTIWDLAERKMIRELRGHADAVNGVSLVPGTQLAVSGAWDTTVKVWNIVDGTNSTLVGHSDAVTAVAVTPDARKVLSSSLDHSIRIWDLQTLTAVAVLKGHLAPVQHVFVFADGKHAVSVSKNGQLIVWRLPTGERETQFTVDAPLTSCSATPKGEVVLAGDEDGGVHFFRLQE